jgi:hypothetical protein
VPTEFSPEAAAIWREVVSSRPVDFFDGGSLRLLGQYCRQMAVADRLSAELDATAVSSDTMTGKIKRLAALSASCTTLATKLRISIQSAVHCQSGKISEKSTDEGQDDLLAGKAKWAEQPRLRAVK